MNSQVLHPMDSGLRRLLFEDFELRLDSGELFQGGSPVKLQPQPARVLEALASRSGEVVSREEIRQLVWGDAFVDFDASLNFCIKEIRRALGDSATSPRFVETVPRRGYRFLRPVRTDEDAPEPPQPPPLPAPKPRWWSGIGQASMAAGLLILLMSLLGIRLHRVSASNDRPKESERSSSEPANEAYRKGLYFLEHEEYEKAEARFRDATLLDKDFASAYAQIAMARLKRMHEAVDPEVTETAARQAIALNPDLAEAHVALGQILFRRDFDWDGAGQEFEQALELEPGNAEAHLAYAFYLRSLGRHGEAIEAVKKARELDPGSMMTRSNYAWYLYLNRQYKEAIRQARSALELYPLSIKTAPRETQKGVLICYETILFSYLMLDDPEMALAAAKAGLEVLALSQPVVQPRDLEEFFRGREQRFQKSMQTAPIDPYFMAKAAMMLGERDRALELLSRCAPKGSLAFPFAAVEPVFDDLHGDPRWSKILDDCLKLPADAPARTRAR